MEKQQEHGHEVKCSFCGNDTSCDRCKAEPASEAGSEHICYECYQKMGGQLPENLKDRTHICISQEQMSQNLERFLSDATEKAFDDLWNAEKRKLKDMSRQDLSRSSFFEGARFMFGLVQHLEKGGGQPESGDEAGPGHEAAGGHEHGSGHKHEHGDSHKHHEGEHKQSGDSRNHEHGDSHKQSGGEPTQYEGGRRREEKK